MKRFLLVLLTVALCFSAVGCKHDTVTKSSEAKILTYKFEASRNDTVLDTDVTAEWNSTAWVATGLPAGANVTALKATFTLSDGAYATVGDVDQTSGTTTNNFSSDITYVIHAEDGTTTKSYTVHVTTPELGFSVFTIDAAISGTSHTVPLTIDNTALTLTGEIPYTYRAAIANPLVVSFTSNGSGVYLSDGTTAMTSGTTTLDFSGTAPTIVLKGTKSATKTYTLNVTASSTPSTDATIAEMKLVFNGVTYTGTISGQAISFPDLPPNVPLDGATVEYTLGYPAAATLKDGSTLLVSGTSVLDLSAAKTLTVTAENTSVTLNYTVTADNTPAMAIVAFDSNAASDNLKWIDVKIYKKAKITGTVRLVAEGPYKDVLIPDFSTLSFWSNVQDGDTIRIWDAYSLKDDDVNKADNTSTIWDIKNQCTGLYNMDNNYGVLFIDDAGALLNAVPYSIGSNTAWSPTSTCTTLLNNTIIPNKFWPAAGTSFVRTDAFIPDAYSAGCYYQLKSGINHGLKPADWERLTGQEYWTLSSPTITGVLNATTGSTVDFGVTPAYTGTGTHSMKSIALDMSLLLGQSANTTNVAMTAPVSPSTTWTLNYTAPSTITVGAKTLRFRTETVVNGVTLLDTATTMSVTVVPAKAITIDTYTISPALIIQNIDTQVTLSATVSAANGASVNSVTADLSAFTGGTSTYALSNGGTGSTYSANFTVPASATAGSYPITLTVQDTVNSLSKTSSFEIVISNTKTIKVNSLTASATTCLGGDSVTLTANTMAANGAAISGVTADLTGFGLGTVNFTLGSSSGTSVITSNYTYTLAIPSAQAFGSFPISVTASDSADSLTATSPSPVTLNVNYAFTNSDMENGGPGGLYATGASISTTEYHGGAASYHYYNQIQSSNVTVPLTTVKFNPKGSITKLVFWFKGTTSGSTTAASPAIRIQVASGGTVKNYYDLQGIVSGTDYAPAATVGGTYATTAINVSAWTKVTLDLSSVVWDNSTTTSATETITDYSFTFRVRGSSATVYSLHDWYIDDIHFEP